MFETVFHYLLESVRVCAHATDLSVDVVGTWLLSLVALFVCCAALRVRPAMPEPDSHAQTAETFPG